MNGVAYGNSTLIRYRVKMYKNRITKWGLDKKSKERETKAIARIKTVRQQAVRNHNPNSEADLSI